MWCLRNSGVLEKTNVDQYGSLFRPVGFFYTKRVVESQGYTSGATRNIILAEFVNVLHMNYYKATAGDALLPKYMGHGHSMHQGTRYLSCYTEVFIACSFTVCLLSFAK